MKHCCFQHEAEASEAASSLGRGATTLSACRPHSHWPLHESHATQPSVPHAHPIRDARQTQEAAHARIHCSLHPRDAEGKRDRREGMYVKSKRYGHRAA